MHEFCLEVDPNLIISFRSPIILSKGGLQRTRGIKTRCFLLIFEIIDLYKVPMI